VREGMRRRRCWRRFAIFNRGQEISDAQGHYLERLSPGVFRKSLKERFAGIRAVLSHGKDPSLGSTVLGKIAEIREEAAGAIARVHLFRAVPELLLDGLRAGVYGASFRGEPIKSETNWHPGISSYNPEGIPEVTRLEIRLRDIGPTPFAAYEGTTATVAGGVGESLPARSLPMEHLDSEQPFWLLGREPSWQLQRKEQRHGRTLARQN
jgi:phage head maturation protease